MYATRPRLKAGASELTPDPDLETARRILQSYRAATREQATTRDRILRFIDTFPADAHLRSRLEGHLTASALVVDAALRRVLLLHHRKLRRWLQLGGHCDGDANLLSVAWREAVEESGIPGLELVPEVIDVDIHEIPARPAEPAHLHLDTRFLIIAPPGAEPVANHESDGLSWLSFEEIDALDVDGSVRRLVDGLRAPVPP